MSTYQTIPRVRLPRRLACHGPRPALFVLVLVVATLLVLALLNPSILPAARPFSISRAYSSSSSSTSATFSPPTDSISRALWQPCSNNDWRPGLWINCTLSLGLSKLRGEFSTCLKWAFDAGAGLVIPAIAVRDPETLDFYEEEGVKWVDAQHYFDVEALKRTLEVSCPEMKLRETHDLDGISNTFRDAKRGAKEMVFGAGDYREHVDQILELFDVDAWTETSAIVIEETLRPYAVWDYNTQKPDFSLAWLDSLKFTPRLAALGNKLARHRLLSRGYLGVHLRVERDYSHWMSFDTQVRAYTKFIRPRPETTIYLACGDASWKSKFQQRFPKHHVVDKWDLFSPSDLSLASTLSVDELAIIDYQPMLHANLVLGIGASSFSYLLGVDRRVDRKKHYSDKLWFDPEPPDKVMLGDERTLLLPPVLEEFYELFP